MSTRREMPRKAGTYMRKAPDWEQNGWTATPNALARDPRIDWDAKGAYAWIASHLELQFEVSAESLAAAGPRGRDHAYGMVKTLEQYGWLTRERYRADDGKGTVHIWTLHFTPVSTELNTWRPSQAKKRESRLVAVGSSPEVLDVQESQTPNALDEEDAGQPGNPEHPGVPAEGVSGTPDRPVPGRPGVLYKEEKISGEDQKTSSSTAPPPREDVEQLCQLLRDRMIANGCKPPTITDAWRTAARLLLDKDGRDLDKALNLIDWATRDEFWMANVQSMGKFRQQYDTLRLRAVQDYRRKTGATQRSRTTVAVESTADAFAKFRAKRASEGRALEVGV